MSDAGERAPPDSAPATGAPTSSPSIVTHVQTPTEPLHSPTSAPHARAAPSSVQAPPSYTHSTPPTASPVPSYASPVVTVRMNATRPPSMSPTPVSGSVINTGAGVSSNGCASPGPGPAPGSHANANSHASGAVKPISTGLASPASPVPRPPFIISNALAAASGLGPIPRRGTTATPATVTPSAMSHRTHTPSPTPVNSSLTSSGKYRHSYIHTRISNYSTNAGATPTTIPKCRGKRHPSRPFTASQRLNQ